MYMQLYMYVHVPEWVERFLQSVEDRDVLWLRIKHEHVTVQHTGHYGNTTGGLSIVLRPDSDHHLGWERRRGEEERGKERGKETGEGDMEKEREGGGGGKGEGGKYGAYKPELCKDANSHPIILRQESNRAMQQLLSISVMQVTDLSKQTRNKAPKKEQNACSVYVLTRWRAGPCLELGVSYVHTFNFKLVTCCPVPVHYKACLSYRQYLHLHALKHDTVHIYT